MANLFRIKFIITYFGILKAGCIIVALNTENKTDELIYLLNNSDSRAIITNKKYSRYLLPALKKLLIYWTL